jgi:hypothetical protein
MNIKYLFHYGIWAERMQSGILLCLKVHPVIQGMREAFLYFHYNWFIFLNTALNGISHIVLFVFIPSKCFWSGKWHKWRLKERSIYLHEYRHRQQWNCSPSWEIVKPDWYVWGSGTLETERELSSPLSPLLWTRTASGVHQEKDWSTWSSQLQLEIGKGTIKLNYH